MNPTDMVRRLLSSWHELDMSLDAPIDQSILLTSRNGTLQFELKGKKSISDRLTRFLQGEPEDESFPLQVIKIKEIFNKCEDREACKTLAGYINALGRYAFAHRAEKTLVSSHLPKLADYQIRKLYPTNRLTAPGSLKRGLPNPSCTFCWLNVSLKILAASSHFDAMLTTRSNDPQLETLRKALFRMVDALRRNWDQHLINALHQELIEELRKSAFGHFCTGQEQDATEFIMQLKMHFPIENPDLIEFASLYEKMDTIWKPGFLQTTDKLEVTVPDENSFRLEEAYTLKNHLEGVRDYYDGIQPNYTDTTLDFIGYNAITRYPKHLEVFVKRGEAQDYINQAKITFDPSGQMTVVEYAPKVLAYTDLIISAEPKKLCTYRVIAAIERAGGKADWGHFVAHTRAPNGTVTTHNDLFTTTNKTDRVWEKSYFLIMEMTASDPIPQAKL